VRPVKLSDGTIEYRVHITYFGGRRKRLKVPQWWIEVDRALAQEEMLANNIKDGDINVEKK